MLYETFYKTFYQQIKQYLQAKGLQSADAEDLCGQIFLYCYQHFHEYNDQKASIGSWLFLITNSRLKNYWRDRKQNVSIDDLRDVLPDEGSDVERASQLDSLRQDVAMALLSLPELQRTIVIFRHFQGMNTNDVSLQLNMTPGAVRAQLCRAMDKLKNHLEALR